MIIAFEGLDGSGKSSQAKLLYKELTNKGYNVVLSPWRRGKGIVSFLKEICVSDYTYSRDGTLAFAAEYWTRWEEDKKYKDSRKSIIIYDRYIYTEIARGIARGIEKRWIKLLYENALKPDITFFLQCDLNDLYERKKNKEISFFESGFDSCYNNKEQISFNELYKKFHEGKYSKDSILESFLRFQKKQLNEYKKLDEYKEFIKFNSSESKIDEIQKKIYNETIKKLKLS